MEKDSLSANRQPELSKIRSGSGVTVRKVAQSTSLEYEGEKDLTIYTLEMLKGRAFVSRQFIADLINSPNLKKAEKDLITQHLSQYSDGGIRVQTFAKKVKEELLPLKRNSKVTTRHDYRVLKEELRGQTQSYGEHIYSSPYKTEAGSYHFSSLSGEKKENYFAHCRTEDLINTTTRRIIEIQSDLFQKDRIESEFQSVKKHLAIDVGWKITIAGKRYEVLELFKNDYHLQSAFAKVKNGKKESYINLYDKEVLDVLAQKRYNELRKLQIYRNTWHERIIQGEIRQAVKDKMTSLQFPTGETAMKIENIGESDKFYDLLKGAVLLPNDLEVGKEIARHRNGDSDRWIICKVLNAGKFMAAQKERVEAQLDDALIKGEPISFQEAVSRAEAEYYVETFDAATSIEKNPIYRFYEKDVQKCLAKFGGKKVTDERGVSWVQIPILPEIAKTPVMAFSVNGLEAIISEKQNQSKVANNAISKREELKTVRVEKKEKEIEADIQRTL